MGCGREGASNAALGLLQNCPCTLYRTSHMWHGVAWHPLSAMRLLLAVPPRFLSAFHL